MLISFLRTLLLYIVLVLTVRLMGKRQIGEMEPSEFVVTMLIANLAACKNPFLSLKKRKHAPAARYTNHSR